MSVAKDLYETYPATPITILGDDDRHLPKREPPLPNVGREKAVEAAREVGGDAIFPVFPESENGAEFMDFNDPARSRGLDTVKHQLEFELGLAAARAEKLKYEHELAREEHELDREWGEQEVDLDEGPEIDF